MPTDHWAIDDAMLKLQHQKAAVVSRLGMDYTEKGFHLRSDVTSLKQLRVAAVMDEFTFQGFQPECELLQLHRSKWHAQLQGFSPDFLFIESAWRGVDNSWIHALHTFDTTMATLIGYCRSRGIPTVFWSKEDPTSITNFMWLASLCDVVLTTDMDSIADYKAALGHDRVFHMHFAAQPRLHNPIESQQREDKLCYAGSYYSNFSERTVALDSFTQFFAQRGGVAIYDRNLNNPSSPYGFPPSYSQYIVGTLKPTDIAIAYKGYKYSLNMNSVTQSQTMFARRVFELLASNTVVVGNYSRGVKNYFGDLTISTDSVATLGSALSEYCSDAMYEKYRLLGLRKVLMEHLYEDRLNRIVTLVFGQSLKRPLPQVLVVPSVSSPDQMKRVEEMVRLQSYQATRLVDAGDVANCAVPGSYLAVFDGRDYYGKNYLLDLMLSTRYCDADGYTKPDDGSQAYRFTDQARLGRSIVKTELVTKLRLNSDVVVKGRFLNTDRFNYQPDWESSACVDVDDAVIVDQGLSCEVLESEPGPAPHDLVGHETVDVKSVLESITRSPDHPVTWRIDGDSVAVHSWLWHDDVDFVFFPTSYLVTDHVSRNRLLLRFRTSGSLNAYVACWFFDQQGARIGASFIPPNGWQAVDVPKSAHSFNLGLATLGEGDGTLSGIDLCRNDSVPFSRYAQRGTALMMTNIYPADGDFYRNAFVHRRVVKYKEQGHLADVMVFGQTSPVKFREFEGINIVAGGRDVFDRMMMGETIKTVCVHFLDQAMWDALKPHLDRLHVVIWCHGSEIQPWWRRTFNYESEAEVEAAKEASQARMTLWREVFCALEKHNIELVFVSRWFADEVFADYGVTAPADKVSIIHNVVDTQLFKYSPKPAEQRLRILSIRPYASNVYANDLTVKCIEELSTQPFFNELSFLICGNGVLFDKTVQPLRRFENVELRQQLFSQSEIAELHRHYGVFLVPSRMDSQGVSRDEAMSSGLVPVTTAVAAIPEFTDSSCAVVVPAEDYRAMADGIARLYHNPDEFLKMSKAASERVRRQSDSAHTITKEIGLIWPS